jgi:hypothetical protein
MDGFGMESAGFTSRNIPRIPGQKTQYWQPQTAYDSSWESHIYDNITCVINLGFCWWIDPHDVVTCSWIQKVLSSYKNRPCTKRGDAVGHWTHFEVSYFQRLYSWWNRGCLGYTESWRHRLSWSVDLWRVCLRARSHEFSLLCLTVSSRPAHVQRTESILHTCRRLNDFTILDRTHGNLLLNSQRLFRNHRKQALYTVI